jgi:hypothetical protein
MGVTRDVQGESTELGCRRHFVNPGVPYTGAHGCAADGSRNEPLLTGGPYTGRGPTQRPHAALGPYAPPGDALLTGQCCNQSGKGLQTEAWPLAAPLESHAPLHARSPPFQAKGGPPRGLPPLEQWAPTRSSRLRRSTVEELRQTGRRASGGEGCAPAWTDGRTDGPALSVELLRTSRAATLQRMVVAAGPALGATSRGGPELAERRLVAAAAAADLSAAIAG